MVYAADGTPHDLILEIFPDCIIHSDPTATYNCFAWAIHEEETINSEIKRRPWWPNRIDSYWPDIDAPDTLDTFREFFLSLGYIPSESPHFEPNYVKVAIYVDSTHSPYHVARQLVSGEHSGCWTSKCGASHDVIHQDLEALEGDEEEGRYGRVALIMKRSISTEQI